MDQIEKTWEDVFNIMAELQEKGLRDEVVNIMVEAFLSQRAMKSEEDTNYSPPLRKPSDTLSAKSTRARAIDWNVLYEDLARLKNVRF